MGGEGYRAVFGAKFACRTLEGVSGLVTIRERRRGNNFCERLGDVGHFEVGSFGEGSW